MGLIYKYLGLLLRPKDSFFALYYETLALLERLRILNNRKDLIIFDDIFPHHLSPFRLAEFGSYLKEFSNVKIYSTATAFSTLKERRSFRSIKREYINRNPFSKGIITKYHPHIHFNAKLAYIVFFHNVWAILPKLELYKIPFIFTLYPGGGLVLNDPDLDLKLKQIFQSKQFRHVIVSQYIVYDYLIIKNLCPKEKITMVFGVVLPTPSFEPIDDLKKQYPLNKSTIDICFVAHKYSFQGKDKGYDIFIETARILSNYSRDIRFHVVGNWKLTDYDISEIEDKITFYGSKPTSFFSEFYQRMDIILSPNRANIINKGAFDGFPTGAVTEASLNGVAMFVTDPLLMNRTFIDNEEIVIINESPAEIAKKIIKYVENPNLLQKLASKGKKKSWEVYNLESQMTPRIKLLNDELIKTESLANI